MNDVFFKNINFIRTLILSSMAHSFLFAQEKIYIESKIESEKLDWMNLLIYFICVWIVIVSIIEMRDQTKAKKTFYSDLNDVDHNSTDDCKGDVGDGGDYGGDCGGDGGGSSD